MLKQWFDFLELDRAEKAKERIKTNPTSKGKGFAPVWGLLFILAFAGATNPNEMLNLPAYSLELSQDLPVGPHTSQAPPVSDVPKVPKVPKVGDELHLKISGFTEPMQGLHVVPDEKLEEEGWLVQSPDALSFTVTPLKPGKLTLPSLVLKNDLGKEIGRTHPFELEIESAIPAQDPQAAQPAPLEPPVGLRFPIRLVILMVTLAAGLAIAGIYAFYRWRKHQNSKKPALVLVKEDPRPEDVIALEMLDQLEKQDLLNRRNFKAFYFGISEIMKSYIGKRYHVEALEATTHEMIQMLQERRMIDSQICGSLENLFIALDQVKFTDYLPTQQEPIQVLTTARTFVQTTRRKPVESMPKEEITKETKPNAI